jgi:hypothetical protein
MFLVSFPVEKGDAKEKDDEDDDGDEDDEDEAKLRWR